MLKRRVWEVLSVAKPDDRLSKWCDRFILSLIFLNILAVVVSSVDAVESAGKIFFIYFERISVAIFLTEYCLRVWSCVTEEKYSHPILGRLRFMATPMAIIDLLAIMPALIMGGQAESTTLRALRLLRLFLLAKTGRYYRSVRLLGRVVIKKREELLITTALMAILLLISSTLMFVIEHGEQPEAFSSIPATMWWAMATLTTVGYGDVAPITGLGKFLGSFVAIMGIGLFALPTGILGSGFLEAFNEDRAESHPCPHCGKDIHAGPEA